MERPETRVFDVQPIPHTKAHRIELVTACLTILRAFQADGKPSQSTPLGSYEQWSSTVRDALIWLGEADPVLCMDVAREEDPKLEAIRNVMFQWTKSVQGKRASVAELIGYASKLKPFSQDLENPEFFDALFAVAAEGRVISSRRLGIWLGRNKSRWVSGARIDKMPLLDGNTTYGWVKRMKSNSK